MKIRTLHQIEITSRCNLRCKYCPSPNLGRPKIDMTWETYEKAVDWLMFFIKTGTQEKSINVAGIGESTMHPEFVNMLDYLRTKVGWNYDIVFATNGLLFNEDMARWIAPLKPHVYVSLHRPERARLAISAARKHGLLTGVSTDPATNPIDWAGQVDWVVEEARTSICDWQKKGWVMVCSDGRITRCSLDANGVGVIGSVHDEVLPMETQPYSLCKTCHMRIE